MDLRSLKQAITRYLKGSSQPEEKRLLNTWLDTLNEKSELNLSTDEQQKEVIRQRILGRLKAQTQVQPSTELPVPKPVARTIAFRPWMKVAAALVPLLLVSIYLIRQGSTTEKLTYTTGLGQQKEIILPDSSHVWLKPKSVLVYPVAFGDTREVELSGEAFFEVEKNPRKKFIVHTAQLAVEVLGTSFDVKAYEQLAEASVTVSTGKVKVADAHQTLGVLLPYDKLVFDIRKSQAIISKTNALLDAKSNPLAFENVSLSEILGTLENYYPVDFQLDASAKAPLQRTDAQRVKLTGSFNPTMRIDQIVEVLNTLAERYQLKITKQNNQQYRVE